MAINRFLALFLWVRSLDIDMPSKAALWSLASYADKDYKAYPSLTTLAKDAAMGRSTLTRKLKELEELNIITRKHRKYEKGGLMSTLYKLNIEIFLRELEDENDKNKKKLVVEKIVPCRTEDRPTKGLGRPGAGLDVGPERDPNISIVNISNEYIQDKQKTYSSIEGEKPSPPLDPLKKADPIPYNEILAAFKRILPASPKPKEFTEARKRALRARARGFEKRLTLKWWEDLFIHISNSPFLTGQVPKRDGYRPFLINIDWLLKPLNFQKIIEGNYHKEVQ